MHEIALCESILETVTEQTRRQGFSRVRRVWLEIGELANVELDALRFASGEQMAKLIEAMKAWGHRVGAEIE